MSEPKAKRILESLNYDSIRTIADQMEDACRGWTIVRQGNDLWATHGDEKIRLLVWRHHCEVRYTRGSVEWKASMWSEMTALYHDPSNAKMVFLERCQVGKILGQWTTCPEMDANTLIKD